MKLSEHIKTAVRNFLEIKEPSGVHISINEKFSHEAEVFKNRLWYRGVADELEDFYTQTADDGRSRYFWGARQTNGAAVRKVHTGIPALMLETVANIATDDLNDIKCQRQADWDIIAKENDFPALLKDAVIKTLWSGDGAFKWSIDSDISQYPIIEFFDASRVDYVYNRGRLEAVIFKTRKEYKNHCYTLLERYDKQGICYRLLDDNGREIDLDAVPDCAGLLPVENTGRFIMALPLMFGKSKRHDGRGKSLFDGKTDAFDSLDEAWSQWMLAIRKGQIKTYIPDNLLPRNAKTGMIERMSDFDTDFIAIGANMGEGVENKITHTQGNIQHEALLQTYVTALDLCLQGIVSPSTLGIDVKKLDNAEAQREKEKTTLYTRAKMVAVLADTVERIVNISLAVMDVMDGEKPKDIDVSVNFGGYASPSFEAQIETMSKASASGVMSIESIVNEIWGDDKTDDWKREEVARIKNERGLLEVEEPAVNMGVIGYGNSKE